MKNNNFEKKVEEVLSRGVKEVIDFNHLKKSLLARKKLRVKLGIDPTSPHLHLGRAVPLLKLRDFQELGHQIVFIIGDFTAVIGDTSDKESERPMLREEEVAKNMKTYISQAAKILEVDKAEIHYNSKWLKKLGYAEIGRQANQFSLAEFINRENIKKRLLKGSRVSLREVLYPLMQGYDSVAIKANLEIGGTDQRFNLLAGRTLQAYYQQEPQDILMTNLILGTDGRKMSSSWGNTININEAPDEMFGKIMSLADELMISYFEHCTRLPLEEIRQYEDDLKKGRVNPRDIKMKLAFEITKMYWGKEKAQKAKDNFINVFQKKKLPSRMPELKLANKNIVEVLIKSGLAQSKSEARRLIEQGGVKMNNKVLKSPEELVKSGAIIQKGKRYFVKII
jgi:tyrosyl-tRNA synthetase